VRSFYPRFERFQQLQAKYDPKGVFRNEFLDLYLD
jgi:hypothetical protein